MPRLPTPHGDAVMLLTLLSSLVEAQSMSSEVREAAVRVRKRRETCTVWPFVTVFQARQRHARTPAPWVHAGTGEKLLLWRSGPLSKWRAAQRSE